MTLLMDDIGVDAHRDVGDEGDRAGAALAVGSGATSCRIVRLSSRSDEASATVSTARDRIGGYRGGMVPFSRRDTPETMLKMVDEDLAVS